MKVAALAVALIAIVPMVGGQRIRGSEMTSSRRLGQERELLAGQEFYRMKDPAVLGSPNVTAAMGNPLKGLIGGARWSRPPLPVSIPSSMEWYNLGLDEIMVGDNTFDWKILDGLLEGSASRNMHVVFSVFVHWPGRPLRLPAHLKDVQMYDSDSGKSPNYGDSRIMTALEQYISALGARYDGDKRIATIHVGLLGFWGEGHTYPTKGLVPAEAKTNVAMWYDKAFKTTQIQARYPGPEAANKGLYDGSLFYTTLDGEANGGVSKSWYMWPEMKKAGQHEAWKKYMIAGETRPEIQHEIFTNAYPARTFLHQDFKETVDTLHISWILHHNAFTEGGYTGEKLVNARKAHAYLGYAFHVSEVAASVSATGVDMEVTVTQGGVAPFYYDLNLVVECAGLPVPIKQGGVNELIEQGQSKTFTFSGLPVSQECLQQVSILLDSSYAYVGRPVVFAQGSNGKVSLTLPLPALVPAPSPTRSATPAPVLATSAVPLPVPVAVPVATNKPNFFTDARSKSGPRFKISRSTKLSTANVNLLSAVGYQGDLFRYHRWGSGGFTYIISGFAPGSTQNISLGFAETYNPSCAKGKRVFSVLVNGASFLPNLDIFALAGCNMAYVISKTATVDGLGKIELKFEAGKQNPFVSFIDVTQAY